MIEKIYILLSAAVPSFKLRLPYLIVIHRLIFFEIFDLCKFHQYLYHILHTGRGSRHYCEHCIIAVTNNPFRLMTDVFKAKHTSHS